MKTKTANEQDWSASLPRNEAALKATIKLAQQIQMANPYGSPEHKAAYDIIRSAVQKLQGIDIGEYDT